MSNLRGTWPKRLPVIALLVIFSAIFARGGEALAQRRPAPELLPDNTLVYVRIPDIQDFTAKMQDTGMGRMLEDEDMQPFAAEMYDFAAEEFEQLRDQIGLSLDEVMELPQGEFCFAIVETPDSDVPFSFVMLLDVGESVDLAKIAEESGEALLFDAGVEQDVEDVGETSLKTINAADPEERLVYFEREGTYGASNNPDLVKEILLRWNLKPTNRDKVFSNNRKFVTIMNRCRGTSDARPDVVYFADPIGIFEATQSGAAGAVAMAFARSIGVTDFLGIGGSTMLGVDDFDGMSHMHLYLASPREGVMKMLAMESGEIVPPTFVPDDTVTYMTLNWDVPKTFDAFEELFNRVSQNDPDALNIAIENNLNENLGIDFVEDIIGNLSGRVVYMSYIIPPARLNSQTNLFGIQMLDIDAAKETIETMFEQDNFPELKEKKVRGITIYQLPGPGARRRAQENRERRDDRGRQGSEDEDPFESQNLRRPEPGFAFIEDYLVVSDSIETIEMAIQTSDGRADALESNGEFLDVLAEVERQTGSSRAGMLMYSRPQEVLRNFYELGVNEENRQRIMDAGDDNPFLGRLGDRLNNVDLPSFDVIEKFLTSSGGVMTSDESGFHYFSFGFRPNPDE